MMPKHLTQPATYPMLHEQEVASAVDPGWLLSTVINGAGRYEPVHE